MTPNKIDESNAESSTLVRKQWQAPVVEWQDARTAENLGTGSADGGSGAFS